MATSLDHRYLDFCVACGEKAASNDRRYLNSDATRVIIPCLRFILSRRLEESGIACNLDTILQDLYICRTPCFTAYNSHLQKDKTLYDHTAKAVRVISNHLADQGSSLQQTTEYPSMPSRRTSRKRAHEQDSEYSHSSPSVSVSVLFNM